MSYYVFDTSSLILEAYTLFEDYGNIVIPSIVLGELEHIKMDNNKDPEVKQAVRYLLELLNRHPHEYGIHVFKTNMMEPARNKGLELNNDIKILMCALDYDKTQHPDDTIFVTNDLSLKRIANLFFGEDSIISVEVDSSDYKGYTDVILTDDQMA